MAIPDRWTWARGLLRLACPHARRNEFPHGHLGRNRIAFHRLFLVHPESTTGSRAIGEDGGILHLRPGSVNLLPAGSWYRFPFQPGFRLAAFHFRLETSAGVDVLRGAVALQQRMDPAAAIEAWGAFALDGPGQWLVAEALLRLHLGRSITIDWGAVGQAIHDASAWGGALDHLGRAKAGAANIAGLARKVGLSRERFSQRFRDRFHQTPRDWHRHQLAARVAARLLADQAPLAAIAAEFGFSDAFSLSRFMRHATGRSPSQLRSSGGAPI
jgi:AraC-like DNA-binding protein